jgi:hypothetical protein
MGGAGLIPSSFLLPKNGKGWILGGPQAARNILQSKLFQFFLTILLAIPHNSIS